VRKPQPTSSESRGAGWGDDEQSRRGTLETFVSNSDTEQLQMCSASSGDTDLVGVLQSYVGSAKA